MRVLGAGITKCFKPAARVLIVLGLLTSTIVTIPPANAIDAAIVTVPSNTRVTGNSATTAITGVSVGGLPAGTTYLVAIGLSNFQTGAILKIDTTTNLTASYGFTTGANTFASFTNISFKGALADVNTALASLKYVSAAGSASGAKNPTIKVTASSITNGYSLNGLNGHFYTSSSYLSSNTSGTYSQAKAWAKAISYKGLPGYVVTITSAEENTFVATAIESAENVWIGATDELLEGDWKWDTTGGSPEQGTLFWRGATGGTTQGGNYASWAPGSEPNNAGTENYAVTNWNGASNGLWNDCGNNGCGANRVYVIEFGTNDSSTNSGFANASSDLGSSTFTLSHSPELSGTSTISVAYGVAGSSVVAATFGTGTKTFTRTSSAVNAGITLNTSVTNQATLNVSTSAKNGTYLETLTATDTVGASATFLITVTIAIPTSNETDTALILTQSSDYGSADDNSAFDITGAISIEAWINTTSNSGTQTILGKNSAYEIFIKNGKFGYCMFSSASADYTNGCISLNVTIPTNEWHHVAITRAASTNEVLFYFDGNLMESGVAGLAGTSSIINSSLGFTLGRRTTASTTEAFYGKIDEVKIWSEVRSAPSVLSDMRSYGGSGSANLKAYFDFNEGSGSTFAFNRGTGADSTSSLTLTSGTSFSNIVETSTYQAYTVVKFPRTYLSVTGWKSPSVAKRIKYLIVAGGGGGGAGWQGGGGGAGGFLESTTSIAASTYYPIVVGQGGKGGYKKFGPASGDSSTAFSITATGGGRGATEQTALGGPWANTSPNGVNASGGSGGGGSHAATYTQTYGTTLLSGAPGITGQGFAGGDGYSVSGVCAAGGGGGAGGDGTAATATAPGNGGTGKSSTIAGTTLNLAGGGGGSGRYGSGCTGSLIGSGASTFGGGNGGVDTGTSGTFNTGGGGGGGVSGANGLSTGGNGGSGLIIIRYITAAPVITLQPVSDTTTAGITDSFTVASTAPTPLTKSVQWQFTADSSTGLTGWTNSNTGTGITTDTYTTGSLLKSMTGYKYRAIVTFSDSDSLTVVETSTAATLTINDSITITSLTTTITQKYGTAKILRTITYTGGTDTKTVSAAYLSMADGKITFETSTALLSVDTRTAAGSHYETITVTDRKGATASYVQLIAITVADTLTVGSDTPTALTYTGAEALFTPSLTVKSGLVSGDVISGATYTYAASPGSCASGGPCSIGEVGPGGGLVFITPTTSGNTTGKYFEAAPVGWSGAGATDPTLKYCNTSQLISGAIGTLIGTGQANTTAVVAVCASGASNTADALVYNGKSDWFIASNDETREMYTTLYKATPSRGGFNTSNLNYWTSTDDTSSSSGQAIVSWFGNPTYFSGPTNELQAYSVRPVRSFTAATTSAPTSIKPTDADTYTIQSSDLTFSSGSASNYVKVVYQPSTIVINKAQRATFSLTPLFNVFYGTSTSATLLTAGGGSDTGTVTFAYVESGSTATGCALSGVRNEILTVTSSGLCNIVATKAATKNYLVTLSDTGTVTFSVYVSYIPAPRAQSAPTEIVISGEIAVTIVTSQIPMIASGTETAAPGETISLVGSGFTGTTSVMVAFTEALFTVNSDTSLTVTVPAGLSGVSGPILVTNAVGIGFSPFLFIGAFPVYSVST